MDNTKENNTKKALILKYKSQLESMGDQQLILPEKYEDDFWDWFIRKSKLFSHKKISHVLRETDVPLKKSFCFKNTYRIAKAFVKRLFYFEGFAYSKNEDFCLKHAFNVTKRCKVNDYSINDNQQDKYNYYIGVKINLSFAKKIYKENGDHKNTQYSLLVAYFMYSNFIDNYSKYIDP